MSKSWIFAFAAVVVSSSVLACSSDSSGTTAGGGTDGGGGNTGACAAYVVPAGTDLSAPAVSFRTDVMPIFSRSCTFSACHGVGAGRLTLSAGDPAASHKALVNVASSEHKTMPRVTPGNPSQSWLMRKMDGDACTLTADCTDPECADVMPKNGDPLEVAERDTVRRWITQGAKDD